MRLRSDLASGWALPHAGMATRMIVEGEEMFSTTRSSISFTTSSLSLCTSPAPESQLDKQDEDNSWRTYQGDR